MVALPLAAQIAGNDEWLSVVETRAKQNLSAAAGLFSATMARVGLALIAVQRGDAVSAEEQYNALAPVPGIMVFYIGTDQVLGMLSVTLSRLDQAGRMPRSGDRDPMLLRIDVDVVSTLWLKSCARWLEKVH